MNSGGVPYIFLDEGGNLKFSDKGSEYFTLTGVLMRRPFKLEPTLHELRFDLIEKGVEIEEFHATEDRHATRDQVFTKIKENFSSLRADSIVVEKRKAHPKVREPERFYPEMLGYLLRWTIGKESLGDASEVIVVTDVLPLNNKRRAIEKAVKTTLKDMLPSGTKHRVMHHDSRSCYRLQVADYVNWAIQRRWERNDNRSYNTVKPIIKSEFQIFKRGTTTWY